MEDEAGQEISAGRRHIIERPRLTRLLDETSARVIMLVAPAGYGKTTLARQWLSSRPHAWYQGSASSGDVAALALGIAEAVEPLISDVGRRLREWLPTSREPEQEVDVIEQFLSEDLAGWPEEAWFVVDDCHLLSSEATEELIRRLFVASGRRLLLTSRQRPAWSSARELLYGDFFELGQSSLAMNTDEANAVMASQTSEASGLVALADGWPAVIGLAALAPRAIRLEERFPEELHDYFAEELFASLPMDTQEGLCRLALVPVVTRAAAEVLVGPAAERVIEQGKEAGVFAVQRAQELTFHPLLRTFLLQKLRDSGQASVETVVARGVEVLAQAGRWADAFALITEFARADLLDILLLQAIVPLTQEGRVATLREWVEFARRRNLASPLLDLAEAELSFRQGLHDRALSLASEAAKSFGARGPLASAAYYRAGQSSYLMDETASALEYFHKAHETAVAPSDARNALWGEFMVSLELERSDVAESLEAFARIAPQDRDTRVRVTNGELIIGIRRGGLAEVVATALPIADFVNEARDPIVRSSFWHIYAVALTLHGDYEKALGAINRALQEIDEFNMEFARPHILVSSAAANIGLQRFRVADRALEEVEELAAGRRDDYVLTNARTVRARLLLQRGMPDQALGLLSHQWSRSPSCCMQAEFLVARAACLTCLGRHQEALSLVDEVQALSSYLEPQLLARWVRVLCHLASKSPEGPNEVRDVYESSVRTGAIDTFVFAYRLHPGVLELLAAEDDLKASLSSILGNAHDAERGRSNGLVLAAEPRTVLAARLTKRETEVYGLLAEGRTNREIAQALVISEVTAKVHVRNVLRKLGARNRTEAALMAARVRRAPPSEGGPAD
jgi:LuxR family transcriptional regulator, maltose regulon positive regulatory protein